jgi:hypothetical protein
MPHNARDEAQVTRRAAVHQPRHAFSRAGVVWIVRASKICGRITGHRNTNRQWLKITATPTVSS